MIFGMKWNRQRTLSKAQVLNDIGDEKDQTADTKHDAQALNDIGGEMEQTPDTKH